ncbi:class I SAM-dependent methyltransferase [Streptomyces sp. NPDC005648]|uniref:class I SAM-dependent DNA methyltransferase n=1 Tax=Streptomyces sp. NPDC005648 TaxID=3157044 RepID=UPI0033A436EC
MSVEIPEFIRSTRTSYDTIADDYSAQFADHLAESPLERALLGAFAEMVGANGGGAPAPVADLGSGPGHVTARLDALGVPVFGVDVSPRMVELARRAHPGLRFHVGSMTALDLPAGTLGGIVALYSIIHVPHEHLPAVFADFHRLLVPGGQVLIMFQFDECEKGLHLDERFGHEISLDYHWHTPDSVAGLLTEAGFQLHASIRREPRDDEKMPRGVVLATKAS